MILYFALTGLNFSCMLLTQGYAETAPPCADIWRPYRAESIAFTYTHNP